MNTRRMERIGRTTLIAAAVIVGLILLRRYAWEAQLVRDWLAR